MTVSFYFEIQKLLYFILLKSAEQTLYFALNLSTAEHSYFPMSPHQDGMRHKVNYLTSEPERVH